MSDLLSWISTKKAPMNQTSLRINQIFSGLVALVVGIISAKTVFNRTWLALLPWVVIGLCIIWFSKSQRQGIWNGAVYGAVLTDSFMLFNYQGGTPHLTFWIFVVALAALGFGVGAFGGWVVGKIKHRSAAK